MSTTHTARRAQPGGAAPQGRQAVALLWATALLLPAGGLMAQRAPRRTARPPARPSALPAPASLHGARRLVTRPWGAGRLELWRLPTGHGALARVDRHGARHAIACDPLAGAWGLWAGDLDRDGRPDFLVALRKRARHDPVVANRPHLYRLAGDRCVPLWRGTRLAGRFVQLQVKGQRLFALERTGPARWRVARYRWRGFGFVLAKVRWRGRRLPRPWRHFFGATRAAPRADAQP